MASGLLKLTDTSFISRKTHTHSSFSYRQSPFWSETTQMSGNSGTMWVTLYNQTNITSFEPVTVLPASTAANSHQISPSLDHITTPVPISTMIHATTIISSSRAPATSKTISKVENSNTPGDRLNGETKPAPLLNPLTTSALTPNNASLSACQEIVISVVIHLTPPSSPVTAYPEDSSPYGSPVQPLDRSPAYYTRSLSPDSAIGPTSIVTVVGGTDPFTAKLWSPLSASAIIGLSSSFLSPPYPLNSSTAFPAGRSSLYPSSISVYSHSSQISPTEDLISTLTDSSFTHPAMILLLVTESSVSIIVEVVSLVT